MPYDTAIGGNKSGGTGNTGTGNGRSGAGKQMTIDESSEIASVWVLQGKKLVQNRIRTGLNDNTKIEVLKGLSANDLVVTDASGGSITGGGAAGGGAAASPFMPQRRAGGGAGAGGRGGGR